MGEYIGASIQLGGNIMKAQADELIDRINSYNLGVDFEGEKANYQNLGEKFGDWQINYGNLDAITDYCDEHGISYHHWYASGYEWSAGGTRRIGDRVEEFNEAEGDPSPVFTLEQLKREGAEKLIELGEWLTQPLPQLTPVDYDPATAEPGEV